MSSVDMFDDRRLATFLCDHTYRSPLPCRFPISVESARWASQDLGGVEEVFCHLRLLHYLLVLSNSVGVLVL